MLMKEIKDDTDGRIYYALDWKTQYCQMRVLLKKIYRHNAVFIKLAMAFATELEQKKLNCKETQKTPNSHSNLEKEKQSWRNQAL